MCVLIRQESLPALIGYIISSHKLHFFRLNLVMDVLPPEEYLTSNLQHNHHSNYKVQGLQVCTMSDLTVNQKKASRHNLQRLVRRVFVPNQQCYDGCPPKNMFEVQHFKKTIIRTTRCRPFKFALQQPMHLKDAVVQT